MKYFDTGPLFISLGFTTNPKAYLKEMVRLGVKDSSPFVSAGAFATVHTMTHEKHGICCIVCLDATRMKKVHVTQLTCLMAHESVHVLQRVREFMGEKCLGEEMEAYTIQWLTQTLTNEAIKQLGKGKR